MYTKAISVKCIGWSEVPEYHQITKGCTRYAEYVSLASTLNTFKSKNLVAGPLKIRRQTII